MYQTFSPFYASSGLSSVFDGLSLLPDCAAQKVSRSCTGYGGLASLNVSIELGCLLWLACCREICCANFCLTDAFNFFSSSSTSSSRVSTTSRAVNQTQLGPWLVISLTNFVYFRHDLRSWEGIKYQVSFNFDLRETREKNSRFSWFVHIHYRNAIFGWMAETPVTWEQTIGLIRNLALANSRLGIVQYRTVVPYCTVVSLRLGWHVHWNQIRNILSFWLLLFWECLKILGQPEFWNKSRLLHDCVLPP